MFTGIITAIGTVAEAHDLTSAEGGQLRRFVIETPAETATIQLGASIACSGVCLTATHIEPGRFTVEAGFETLARTTAGGWTHGTRINLERALKAGDELGGHSVSGHVDGRALLVSRVEEGDCLRLAFVAPAHLARFIAPKGSVTLDGISLTVNDVVDLPDAQARFALMIIPHTRQHTTLETLDVGEHANLEIDTMARYLDRLLEQRAARGGAGIATKQAAASLESAPV